MKNSKKYSQSDEKTKLSKAVFRLNQSIKVINYHCLPKHKKVKISNEIKFIEKLTHEKCLVLNLEMQDNNLTV